MKVLSNKILLYFVSFIFFILAGIYITFPLFLNLGNLTTDLGDTLLISWIHSWVIHSLNTNVFSLFEGNIFYPYHNTIAFSDLFLTSSLIAYLPVKLIGQPIAANN